MRREEKTRGKERMSYRGATIYSSKTVVVKENRTDRNSIREGISIKAV